MVLVILASLPFPTFWKDLITFYCSLPIFLYFYIRQVWNRVEITSRRNFHVLSTSKYRRSIDVIVSTLFQPFFDVEIQTLNWRRCYYSISTFFRRRNTDAQSTSLFWLYFDVETTSFFDVKWSLQFSLKTRRNHDDVYFAMFLTQKETCALRWVEC